LFQYLLNSSNLLSTVDKLGLIDDIFALALSGSIPLHRALELIQNFSEESNTHIWKNIIDNMNEVVNLFQDTEVSPFLSRFILKLFKKIGTTIGWESNDEESDLIKSLRPRILNILADHGDIDIINIATSKFEILSRNFSAFPSDLAMVIFKFYVRNGGEKEHNEMIELYLKLRQTPEVNPELVIKSLVAIGMVRNSDLLDRVLEMILKSEYIRSQDLFYPWNGLCSTLLGKEKAWKFLQSNWEDFKKRVKGSLFGHLIRYATGFNTIEKAKEVEDFFKNRINDEIRRVVANRLESIQVNTKSISHHREETLGWLKERYV